MTTTIHAQFADDTMKVITAVFGISQDPDVYPNQADVDSTDDRYAAFYTAMGTFMQQFLVAPGD